MVLNNHGAPKTLKTEHNGQVFTFTSSVVLYGTCARREHDGGVPTVHLRPLVSRQNFNIQNRRKQPPQVLRENCFELRRRVASCNAGPVVAWSICELKACCTCIMHGQLATVVSSYWHLVEIVTNVHSATTVVTGMETRLTRCMGHVSCSGFNKKCIRDA
jgi:hypothetical protein